MPALSRQQRRLVALGDPDADTVRRRRPLGYFRGAAPAALQFLLNFNDSQFNVQVRASEYYGFFASTLIACGVVFEVPVAILGAVRVGITSVENLRRKRRYAYLVWCAVAAAALPGVDPGFDAARDRAADRSLRAQHRLGASLRRPPRER
ncbi:MAG: twin-arginine translocase subunit TatC [Solirubrobacterales bacterium]